MGAYEKSVDEMIDRYVYAVTKRLPEAQRADIEKELRSLIDDMLTSRTGTGTPGPQDIEAVLKELGRPSALAAKYRGTEQHLIGPEYYDLYLMIVKIVMIVAASGTALAQIIGYATAPPANVAEAIGNFFGNVIFAGIQAFAIVTFVFAIIERYAAKNEKFKSPEFAPSDLPPVPAKKAVIGRGEPIAGIIFTVIIMILFNAAPWIFGVNDLSTKTVVPVFNLDVLTSLLPLINVMFGLSILKEVARLISGQYTLRLAAAVTIINIITLVVFIYVFASPAIWNAGFMASLHSIYGFEWAASAEAAKVWDIVPKAIIGLTIFGYFVDTIVTIVRALWHRDARRSI